MVRYRHPFSNPDLADGWGSWAGGRSQAHRGLDYPQPQGTPIPAVASGTVAHNLWHDALGWVLLIAHADGMHSGYCHMHVKSPHAAGTSITRGQQIGIVGDQGGASEGNHLHLTITYTTDGTWNNGDINVTTDPWVFINARLNDPETPTPIPAPEEDTLYIRALTNGANGYALAGYIYSNDIGGHWRGLTNLEAQGYVVPLGAEGKIRIVEFNGKDLELLFALAGMWEQSPLGANPPQWGSGNALMGSGPLTGRLRYPGAAGTQGTWHYPYNERA